MNVIERAVETVIGLNSSEDPKALARRVMMVVRAGYGHGLSEGRPVFAPRFHVCPGLPEAREELTNG